MNKDYDAILIIPPKIINGKVYFKKCEKKKRHSYLMYEYIKKYHIPILSKVPFTTLLASLGYTVLRIAGTVNYLTIYLPEIITKRQRKISDKLEIRSFIKEFSAWGIIINKEGKSIGYLNGYEEIYSFLNEAETQEMKKLKKR